ncbi:hypothetical protein H1D32_12005 [Anaerobacillus sp. CMMVII]|uniref:hypothetical protein n=1 Tax=Anaerobacillus sp. CMMVII TaxID=2755588 RepID=UPI0021B70A81|nr:hypothetical protein [Anaerobacillus sp. CMMVII]MCT8138406.1 hypothetical protein [Anaerobacillus sp. CMMVII]
MAKKKKEVFVVTNDKYSTTMKVVTSNTCFVCKNQCARGLAYLERMSKPGAIGKGVPCILTKGKGYK